jgi:hypothetical protein
MIATSKPAQLRASDETRYRPDACAASSTGAGTSSTYDSPALSILVRVVSTSYPVTRCPASTARIASGSPT